MHTIQDTIAEVQTVIKKLAGIRFAPNFPMDKPPTGVTAICWANSGRYIYSRPIGIDDENHTVYLDIIRPHGDLVRDLKSLEPYLRSVPKAIDAAVNSGEIVMSQDIISMGYTTVNILWGQVEFTGYRFIIEFYNITDDE